MLVARFAAEALCMQECFRQSCAAVRTDVVVLEAHCLHTAQNLCEIYVIMAVETGLSCGHSPVNTPPASARPIHLHHPFSAQSLQHGIPASMNSFMSEKEARFSRLS